MVVGDRLWATYRAARVEYYCTILEENVNVTVLHRANATSYYRGPVMRKESHRDYDRDED